jgi:hypothetical protein
MQAGRLVFSISGHGPSTPMEEEVPSALINKTHNNLFIMSRQSLDCPSINVQQAF